MYIRDSFKLVEAYAALEAFVVLENAKGGYFGRGGVG